MDARLTPARPDLAAAHLQGAVEAERFAEGVLFQVTAGVAPVRAGPAPDAAQESQALFGETFAVFEERDGFGWGQATVDGYVGWVEMDALAAPVLAPTHRVGVLRTYVFSEPDLKSAPHFLLSRNARLTVERWEGRFAKIARSGYAPAQHLVGMTAFASDWVAVAEEYVGTPYFWGARESLGVDCSGLVQAALGAAGIGCPRDSDQQEAFLGAPVAADQALARGDLVFWDGHVGIMVDGARLLHANAYAMAVAIEPLADAAARLMDKVGPIRAIRRLPAGRV